MELPVLVAFTLLGITVAGVVGGADLTTPWSTETALVEQARYDRYYDIFRYWWPWFSDLATVVAIKLKIWVVLVAMLVFGDGYYWSKWTSGTNVFEKSQWTQPPGAGVGWGRRRKRRSSPTGDAELAEVIFNTLDIEDDECRKRIVCELYLEAKRVPAIWRVLSAPGYEVFSAYRPKNTVFKSSDCRKLYRCPLLQVKSLNDEMTDSDWRWPR